MSNQVPQQSPVPIQMLPMAVGLGVAQVPTPEGVRSVVQIVIHLPSGQTFGFLDADAAEKIAADMKQYAQLARTGLSLARPDQIQGMGQEDGDLPPELRKLQGLRTLGE